MGYIMIILSQLLCWFSSIEFWKSINISLIRVSCFFASDSYENNVNSDVAGRQPTYTKLCAQIELGPENLAVRRRTFIYLLLNRTRST